MKTCMLDAYRDCLSTYSLQVAAGQFKHSISVSRN